MAATLSADQAIQRLIQSPARGPTNRSNVMTPQKNENDITNGNSPSSSRPAVRNGQYFRSFDGEITMDAYEGNGDFTWNNGSSGSMPVTIGQQIQGGGACERGRGRGGSVDQPTIRGEEIDESGGIQDIISTQMSSPVADVQRCLKNIIVSQVDIIKRQQQLLADKERQIEDLRRENNALKSSMRSPEKRLPTQNVAQQCDLIDKPSPPVNSRCDPPPNDVDTKGGRNDSSHRKRPSERSRRTSDFVNGSSAQNDDTVGILRSGRRRATIWHDQNLLAIKSTKETSNCKEDKETMISDVPTKRRSGSRVSKTRGEQDIEEVQTPRWRIVQVTASGGLEGTENITDDAFAKRHQKYELEERRVIRRDKMRQRELMFKEKLMKSQKQHRLRKQQREKADSESSFTSTPLDISELEAIAVYETLPRTGLKRLFAGGGPDVAVKKRKFTKK